MFWRVWNSVLTMPGQTTCTLTPASRKSMARRRMRVKRKALLAV